MAAPEVSDSFNTIRNISARHLGKGARPLSYCSSWLPTMSCFNFCGWSSSSFSRTFIIWKRVRQPIIVKAVASLEATNLSRWALWKEPLQEGGEQGARIPDCQGTTADLMRNRDVFDASSHMDRHACFIILILSDEYIYLVLPCLNILRICWA